MRYANEGRKRRMLCISREGRLTKDQAKDKRMQLGMLHEALKAFDLKGDADKRIDNDPADWVVGSDVRCMEQPRGTRSAL